MPPPPLDISFVGSFPRVEKCPPARLPEFAFVGRSNVGKSSLINMLSGRRKIAKTSATPGKTQLINLFDVGAAWRLVDLPGYGYAKLSKKHRASLEAMIKNYLAQRTSLYYALVLIDAKIPVQSIDRDMIHWLAEREIPQAWVFTKVDKGRTRETQKQLQANVAELAREWTEAPPTFRTSAEKRTGREELLSFIESSAAQGLADDASPEAA